MVIDAAVAMTVVAIVVARSEVMTKLRVKWVKSSIGYPKDQKATIQALGFRKLQQTVEHNDQPAVRGMIRKVIHLVQVEEISSETL